jgi:S1-C subfamily serine protease
MIRQGQPKSGENLSVAAAALALVLLGTATVFLGTVNQANRQKPLTPAEISARNLESVVKIGYGWKLVDTSSGRQLHQLYFPNLNVVRQVVRTACCTRVVQSREPIIRGGPDFLPMFVPVGDGVEPLLTAESGNGHNKPIGETAISGSGFVVSSDGYILTNRHIAAWNSTYIFPDRQGVLLVSDGAKLLVKAIEAPNGWIPAKAKVLTHVNSPDPAKLESIDQFPLERIVEGRNDSLDIIFARASLRLPAKLVRVSDQADAAIIKVNPPRPLRKCELNNNYDSLKPGQSITVMGYSESLDPTASGGHIADVVPGKSSPAGVLGLTMNPTAEPNRGGPVFDEHGRVIGLFTVERKMPFAVPLRYGMELMGLSKVK